MARRMDRGEGDIVTPESYHEVVSQDEQSPNGHRYITNADQYWRDMGKRPRPPNEDLPASRYENVDVLLVRWDADNLEVVGEIEELKDLLTTVFNFEVECAILPDENAEEEFTRTLMNFRRGKGLHDLMILYYGGHAGGTPGQCVWAASNRAGSPTLNFSSTVGHLLNHHVDTLIILDCCFSSIAVSSYGRCDNWFLGASSKESTAPGVSPDSFTSAFIRALKYYAQRYWTDGTYFTVQSVHSQLNVWEQHLEITPNIVRLTKHECESTELTPLLKRRNRGTRPHSSNTHPNVPSALPAMPKPPQKPSSTHKKSTNDFTLHAKVLSSGSTKALESRPSSQPNGSGSSEVVSSGTCNTILTTLRTTIVESDTSGFLHIHEPMAQADVDLIFVHGGGGHALKSCADLAQPPLWLDALISVLSSKDISARVLSLAWSAGTWLSPDKIRRASCDHLLQALDQERQGDAKKRPLIFLGQDVGGFLIKQAVEEIVNSAFADEDFHNPIKACFFFGVPHQGQGGSDDFADLLARLQCALQPTEFEREKLVKAFKSSNSKIRNLTSNYKDISADHSIATVAFYEKGETLLPMESAALASQPKYSLSIDANHQELMRLPASTPNREAVIAKIANTIFDKVQNKPVMPSTQLGPIAEGMSADKERVFPHLRNYDTVFLIDNSDSMYGGRWKTAATALGQISEIAVQYDNDGVDVRFFNDDKFPEQGKDLKNAEEVMRLFKANKAEGPTLTADVLDRILGVYFRKLHANIQKDAETKPLNLIIFTDGEPDPKQDVGKVIQKFAKKLDELSAWGLQVGLQFVQIGGDEKATKFLDWLDNDLEEKYKLDRDMVDTVKWTDGHEVILHEKVLLGGILKRYDDVKKTQE